MKRRLSIAIALVGNPSIVFLDEPSSGLDPEHRRDLWNILLKCREKRSILLTTHSMEEADALCNRIGIITEGVLRCIGSQT
jgi:ABC-type multidrug transport system ATPase subunit